MADIWKVEFHVIAKDGDAIAWEEDLAMAIDIAEEVNAIRIDKVIYYQNKTSIVWEPKGV